jgi:hypothetical protein
MRKFIAGLIIGLIAAGGVAYAADYGQDGFGFDEIQFPHDDGQDNSVFSHCDAYNNLVYWTRGRWDDGGRAIFVVSGEPGCTR